MEDNPIVNDEYMRLMADMIKSVLPEGYGFTFQVFPFHREGRMFYISNAQRDDMIDAMEQQLASLKLKNKLPKHRGN